MSFYPKLNYHDQKTRGGRSQYTLLMEPNKVEVAVQ